jgi:rSAM/selenodomain-associated transferase 1
LYVSASGTRTCHNETVMPSLVLFAKRPVLGRVKTRLVPPLMPQQALELYEAFLSDQLRFLTSFRSSGWTVEACLDGPWTPGGALAEAVEGALVTAQGPGDLGDRMLRAFARVTGAAPDPTVIIGADAPSLPRERVTEALRILEEDEEAVVVSPAEDGGYVLIGMTSPHPEVFAGVPWGSAEVMERTRAGAAAGGVRLTETAPWYDVDDARGLRRLHDDLRAAPTETDRAPATLRCLRNLARVPMLGFLGSARTDMV